MKWLSEEAVWAILQIAVKRREAKSKGEKERYTHAEFQRIARRDKKAFLSKEIEENNRMGKTRDFKKIRDTKGTFHVKMGAIKDKNGMDLTEAQDIKKRWQEYTKELYKKEKVYRFCLSYLWVRKIPWRRKQQPTPVFLLGESHGQRSWWASLWGHIQSDMT